MSRKSISWILNFTSNLPNNEEKIKCLLANDNSAMRIILRFTFDPHIKWLLPEGEAPYTPCEFPYQENILYAEARKLYLFVEGGNPDLNQQRREALFIKLLEVLDPQDAKLVVAMKDKTMPFKGITPELVLKAFPGLF